MSIISDKYLTSSILTPQKLHSDPIVFEKKLEFKIVHIAERIFEVFTVKKIGDGLKEVKTNLRFLARVLAKALVLLFFFSVTYFDFYIFLLIFPVT